jgi:hypothetical protein
MKASAESPLTSCFHRFPLLRLARTACQFALRTALPALLLAGVSATAAEPGFSFRELDARSLGLYDGGKPVLVYNHGVISRPGVPVDRARSTYVHPLYGLDGEVLSDDFPKDHYHHRGLFWGWPHVISAGKEYDLWMLKGIEQRFEKWLGREADAKGATLALENGWYVGDKKVMEEKVRLRVGPVEGKGRAIDVDLSLKPTAEPVALRGAEGKSYGGITFRIAPGTNTVITIPSGVTAGDLPITNLAWADLSRRLEGRTESSGVAIFISPKHPDFPPEWLTRHYGVLCVGWPGVKQQTIPVGQQVNLSYRVWLHRGRVSPAEIAAAYAAWAGPEAAPKSAK